MSGTTTDLTKLDPVISDAVENNRVTALGG